MKKKRVIYLNGNGISDHDTKSVIHKIWMEICRINRLAWKLDKQCPISLRNSKTIH